MNSGNPSSNSKHSLFDHFKRNLDLECVIPKFDINTGILTSKSKPVISSKPNSSSEPSATNKITLIDHKQEPIMPSKQHFSYQHAYEPHNNQLSATSIDIPVSPYMLSHHYVSNHHHQSYVECPSNDFHHHMYSANYGSYISENAAGATLNINYDNSLHYLPQSHNVNSFFQSDSNSSVNSTGYGSYYGSNTVSVLPGFSTFLNQ
jgi:hypothetical protein